MPRCEKKTVDFEAAKKIREQVEARVVVEAQKLGGPPAGGGEDSEFVRRSLDANELGDGMLFAELLRGEFLYNKSSAEWLRWAGHHWARDVMDAAASRVEMVAERYIDEAAAIAREIGELTGTDAKGQVERLQDLQKRLYARVSRLRSDRGRMNALKFAHTNKSNPLAIRGDELDAMPWLLACSNGVVELQTGELRHGRRDDMLEKACPTEWTGIDTPAPAWDKFLAQIFSENMPLVDYVGRLFGYACTGLTIEHVLPVLHGQGRNGKGTLVETISRVLGSLAAPIQSEMLLDQGRSKSSAGPSPDIMALRGLRMAFGSESDEGRRFSPSRVKWLSGGDTLVGRAPHDRHETHFLPTHTLFLLTNHKPHAPADDFAFWERVHLVPFPLSFVAREPIAENERPADKHLPDKLRQEASGILAWLVRGCLAWQQRGLDPPAVVKDATAEYRREEDLVGDFIEECCYVDASAEVSATDFYTSFSEWWEANVSKKPLSQKKFGKIMAARFRREKAGTYRYFGVGLA